MSGHKNIGKYTITGTLGRGSMGVVYKAVDPEIGRTVAIKTLRNLNTSEFSKNSQELERFKVEARAAGNLRHPNLITIFDVSIEGDTPYIVMDFVEGQSLDTIIAQHKGLYPEVALYYLQQAAEGMLCAHEQGIIHRDIKPGNMVVDNQNRLYVLDFGVATINKTLNEAGRKSSGKDPVMGTPAYMSPEQILNRDLTPLSDVFALGIVAYELFSAQRPFLGRNYTEVLSNILNSEPMALSAVCRMPLEVDAVFETVLQKDKEGRYQSAVEFVQELGKAFGVSRIERPSEDKLPGGSRGYAKKERATEWKTLGKKKRERKPTEGDLQKLRESPEVSRHVEAQKFEQGLVHGTGSGDDHTNTSSPFPGQPLRGGTGQGDFQSGPGDMFRHGTMQEVKPCRSGNSKRKEHQKLVLKAGLLLAVCGTAAVVLLSEGSETVPIESIARSVQNEGVQNEGVQNEGGLANRSVLDSRKEHKIEIPRTVKVPAGKVVAEMTDQQLIAVIINQNSSETLILQALDEAENRKLLQLVEAGYVAMKHPSHLVRVRVARVIAETNNPDAAKVLVIGLDDYDPFVRQVVAESLGKLGRRASLGYLKQRYLMEDNAGVKGAIARAIEEIQGYPFEIN